MTASECAAAGHEDGPEGFATSSQTLRDFLRLETSTTFYLESRSLFGSAVEVEVLDQRLEQDAAGGALLRRLSTLYIHRRDHALIVAESVIHLDTLPPECRATLVSGAVGIGKLLDPDNRGLIRKQSVETRFVDAPPQLRTRCDWAVCRHYRLWFGGACCAEIRETCNEESLARLESDATGLASPRPAHRERLARSRSTVRIGGASVDVPTLLRLGRELLGAHADARLPALLGIEDVDRLALLLAAVVDGRRIVLCPPESAPPAQCDIGIGAGLQVEPGDVARPAHEGDHAPASGFAVLSSGTLGTPKLIWHDADRLLATAEAVVDRLALGDGERVLVSVPVHHLYGLGAALMPALLAGCDVLLLPRSNLLSLNDALRTFRPHIVYSTPHLIRGLLKRKDTAQAGCRGLILAGDGIPATLHEQAVRVFHHVHNLYGSSELGVIAISPANAPHRLLPLPGVLAIPAQRDGTRSNLQVVHPFPATHLDTGDGPARLQRPWDTRDVAEFAADGAFRLHGRADLSLNRAGKLVLLGELEQIAMDWPGVALAVALATEEITAAGQGLLLAVKAADDALTEADLRRHASSTLPVFARPDHYRIVRDLPCLASGKPDRTTIQKEYRHGAAAHH